MEKFYTIKDNYANIILKKEIYPVISVKKALSNFMDDIYIKLDSDDNNIIIQLGLKEDKKELEKIIGELYNEFLRESLRYEIAVQTKNLRELIVGRALYTTCIDVEEDQEEIQNDNYEKEKLNICNEEYDVNDIAVNWFDKYSKEEE